MRQRHPRQQRGACLQIYPPAAYAWGCGGEVGGGGREQEREEEAKEEGHPARQLARVAMSVEGAWDVAEPLVRR